MAESAARYFATLVKDNDEVAMLRANSLESVSVREKSFLAALKELHPKTTIYLDVMAGAQKGDDYVQSVLLLTRHPNIKAVLTPFSASSMAMIKALKDNGLAGKVLQVGFGVGLPPAVVDAIDAGALSGWIAQQPKLIGIRGIQTAADLINNKPVPPTIDVEYFLVTKANLNESKIKELRN
jgi:ribose transport system substrate-binding protein